MSRTDCGRLGCAQPATWLIRPQYESPVRRCDDHVDETVDAYAKFENRQQAGVTLERIR